jgi:5'-3' exonuclease
MFGARPPVARPIAQRIAVLTAPIWRRFPGAIRGPLPAPMAKDRTLPGVAPSPLLAVDAPSMLFRAFYALPKTITGPDGKSVNALLGGANLILREVEKHEPRAVVLCFGPDAAHYRTELYPSYHEKREEEMPDELPHQFAACREFFEAFGWTVATSENLEADDLLGSYANLEAAKRGGRALLLTGDRDMYQCAGEGVTVLYVVTGKEGAEEVGPEEVRERYGIGPELVPDFIALRGDPSDGLPGAKGVGPKTAAELLRAHGSLEGVLENAIRERRPKLRGALIEAHDDLLAFKQIATLHDAGVERLPDRPTDWDGAAEAARGKGMNRLAERLEKAGG